MGILKSILEYIVGDCDTCKHKKDCPYIKEGKGSCFEIGGFKPHYERENKK